MSTGVYVIPAAILFFVSSLLFTGSAKAPPGRARIMRVAAGIAMAAGLVFLVLAFMRLFGG